MTSSLDVEGGGSVAMTVTSFARPDADDQLRATVRACKAVPGSDFVYGGLLGPGGVRLTSFIGARTRGLDGLLVQTGCGLGGKVSAARRPEIITDYALDDGITHDYDRPVLLEGIRSVAAVPVVVGGRTRGLLYAATRANAPIGDQVVDAIVRLAARLADRLQLDDEVDTRLRLLGAALPDPTSGTTAVTPVEVRDVYRELRVIAQLIDDPALQDRLLQTAHRLTGRGAPAVAEPDPGLTRRELDVLAEVALGCTNKEIADRLALATETVKAYLRSAGTKLGTGGRFQAVTEARRLGLLP